MDIAMKCLALAAIIAISVWYSNYCWAQTKQTEKKKVTDSNLKKLYAEVKPHNGVPTLFINGKPDSAMSYMTYRPAVKYFRQFGEAGVHLYSFSAAPGGSAYNLARPCWVAPDRFDFSDFEERVRMLLEAGADAYFFPRLYLTSPRWWDEKHRNELVTFDQGDGNLQPFYHHPPDKRVSCWASQVWRNDMAFALRRFIEHVQSSPYGDRVIGYHLASGTTEEWMMWGGNENKWVDYSEPHQRAFRQWLRDRYETVEALRKAWNDLEVTFETVVIPTKRERESATLGVFRDPAKERRLVDFYLFQSDLVADTIAYFARVVKKATRDTKLVGVFYGYVLQLAGEQRQQNAGHLALRKVWDCPDIDFLTSPTSYFFRTPGTGYSHFMSLTDSVKLHGKLWFDENDIRTWLVDAPIGSWGRTDTYEETLKQEQREFANVLCQGVGMWWFDMGGGWFDDERILRDIAKMKRIADESINWDRSSVNEAAFIVDDHSLAYMQVGNKLSRPLLMEQLLQLGRMGTPFSCYALDDLLDMPPHKVYLFLNCFAPTEEHRRAIERLKSNGCVLVWFYAPGFLSKSGVDMTGMERLTGIKLAFRDEAVMLRIRLEGNDLLLEKMPDGAVYGTDMDVRPLFYADDPDAKVLGRLPGGEPGLVVKRFKDWTSIYTAAPAMPSWLLRNICREAGVHLYVETDEIIYANRSLLAINVNEKGERYIKLPMVCDVYDLFSDKWLTRGTSEFKIQIASHGTKLLRLEPAQL